MTPAPPSRRFDWSNLKVRALSAAVLAPLAVGAILLGGWLFLLLLSVAVALLAIEWSLMSAPTASGRMAWAVAAAALAAAFTAYLGHAGAAWAVLGGCAVLAGLAARNLAGRPADAAFGAVYIGAPTLCLLWLRTTDHGGVWTLLLFAVAWSADIAAFLVGSLLKGPRLWPRFSPNKTWSGFCGGLVAATAAGATVAAVWNGDIAVPAAAAIGFAAGLATMAGDLWESMIKRRFGVKDSGALIPGHGGLLDRVDGLMFAILAVSAARLIHLAATQ